MLPSPSAPPLAWTITWEGSSTLAWDCRLHTAESGAESEHLAKSLVGELSGEASEMELSVNPDSGSATITPLLVTASTNSSSGGVRCPDGHGRLRWGTWVSGWHWVVGAWFGPCWSGSDDGSLDVIHHEGPAELCGFLFGGGLFGFSSGELDEVEYVLISMNKITIRQS